MSAVTNTERQIRVMQAFTEGAQIEYRKIFEKEWKDCISPCWNWGTVFYRVKATGVEASIPKQTLIDSLNAALHGSYLSKKYIRAILNLLEKLE